MERIDVARLVSDLKTTAALLKALKAVLRASGHRVSPLEARDLRDLKGRATRLCCLRAHLRGRLHLRRFTREEQAAFIHDEEQVYTLNAA